MDTDGVSAVLNYRESLRLDLNREVSVCFDLEEQTSLGLVGTLPTPTITREIKKIYGRDYPELIAKTPRLSYPQPVASEGRR